MKDKSEINKRQKKFYETFEKNLATKFWYAIRNGLLTKLRKSIGVENFINRQHIEWIGDISGKKVLDLGCYAGNSLSIYLAQNSKKYIAIDLSENAISSLDKRLKNFPNAHAEAIDFLSEDFRDNNFDLIYAYAVLHHFNDVDGLVEKLKSKLSKNGRIISYDPTSTSKPIWLLRRLYRPFQSDRDWEWPFTKSTIKKFSREFELLDRRGVLGKSKWFFLLNFLPISKERRKRIGQRWHEEDWNQSANSDKRFYNCMQVTMHLEKK